MTAKFELKGYIEPVFKKKKVPYAYLPQINELNRLERTGVLSKIEYSQWTSLTIYAKKTQEIRVCADFSTGLNAALKDDHDPLTSPEEIFAKLSKLAALVEGDQKAPFSIATTPRCKEGRYSLFLDCSTLPLIRTL